MSRAPDDAVVSPVGAAAKTSLPESPRQQGIRVPELCEVAKTAETPKKVESPEKCEEPTAEPPEFAAAVDIESTGEIEGAMSWDFEEMPDVNNNKPISPPAGKLLSMMRQRRQEGTEQQAMSSDESSSDEKEEGKSPRELHISYLLSGLAVKITEEGQTRVMTGAKQTIREHCARYYNVVFMRAPAPMTTEDVAGKLPTRICRLVRDEDAKVVGVGSAMTTEEVERGMVANVKKITETMTRSVYHEGVLVTRDETERVFNVDFLAGIR